MKLKNVMNISISKVDSFQAGNKTFSGELGKDNLR